jgi:hypothetical protein
MARVSKREFFKYMSALYEDKYRDNDSYQILLDILSKADDIKFLNKMRELADMDLKERLHYRYAMAVQGKEFTPLHIEQYISVIKYALRYIDTL